MPKPQATEGQGARGWIVVGASFVTMTLLYGLWYSYSVFLVALLKEFGWSRSVTAGAFSLFALVHAAVGPFFGPVAERIGPRRAILSGGVILAFGLMLTAAISEPWQLYLSFGLVAAMGIGFSGYVPLIILIRGWFPVRFGTVAGIATAGISMGITILIPVCELLIEHVGWRWTFRVLGIAVLGWLIPATLWLLRENPDADDAATHEPHVAPAQPARTTYWTLPQAVCSLRFWGLCLVLFTSNSAVTLFMVHQVAYLIDHGVPSMTAATVGGIVGLTSIAGKAGWGYLLDRTLRERVYTLASISFVLGIGILVLAGAFPLSPLPYLYAVVLGLGYAITAPFAPAVAGDLFGGPGFSTIFGSIHLALGLGTAVGAWAGGEVFDLTGSYAVAMGGALVLQAFSCVLLWAVVAPRHPNPPPAER